MVLLYFIDENLLHMAQAVENIANVINVLRKFVTPFTPIGSS